MNTSTQNVRLDMAQTLAHTRSTEMRQKYAVLSWLHQPSLDGIPARLEFEAGRLPRVVDDSGRSARFAIGVVNVVMTKFAGAFRTRDLRHHAL